jgi:hypothetical protein
MKIPTPTPSQPGPSLPIRNRKDVMHLRAVSRGSKAKTRSKSMIDCWEDDGGSVVEEDAA